MKQFLKINYWGRKCMFQSILSQNLRQIGQFWQYYPTLSVPTFLRSPLCFACTRPGSRFMQTWRQGGTRLVPDLCHPGARVAYRLAYRLAPGSCQPGTSLAPGKIFGRQTSVWGFQNRSVYITYLLRAVCRLVFMDFLFLVLLLI